MEKLQSLSVTMLKGLAIKHGVDATLEREQLVAKLAVVLANESEQADEKSTVITETSSWANITGGNRKDNQNYNDAMAYPMSDGLKKWVMDLAKRHHFTEEQIAKLETMTSQQARAFVDEYQHLPLPASTKQLELIYATVAEIRQTANRVGVPENVAKYANFNIPQEVITKLTGGREGTAGSLIDKLFEINKELRPYRPLSEKQADMIVPWFLCPDVPFETYGVSKKLQLIDEETGEIKGERLMTPEEFKTEVMSKFTASDASFFIDQYMPVVRAWERTRITQSQIKYIRDLESRMADLSVGIVKEWAYNPETGNVEEVYSKRQKQYNPIAYEMLPEEQLLQMSREEADKYMQQLRLELNRPMESTLDFSQSQQLLQDKTSRYKDGVDSYTALVDFTYKLDAVCSFTNDELRDEITELFVHGVGQKSDVMAQIVNYIDMAIDMKGIGFANLIEMADESDVAMALLETHYPVEYDKALHGEKSPEKKANTTVKQNDASVQDFLSSL